MLVRKAFEVTSLEMLENSMKTLIVLLFASIELSNLLMPPREPGKVRGETTENKIIKEVKGDKNN